MSVHYAVARDGYEFWITKSGKQIQSIKDKFVDRPQEKFKKCVPQSWLTQGYVEELRSDYGK